VSGAAVMYCPGMKQLVQIVKSGECAGIVMKEHTRLLRPEDFGDWALLEVLKEHKVKIYHLDGVIDLSTNTGQFMATVQFGMAAYERRIIRERTTAAKEELRRAGKCASADHTLGFGVGYDWDKQQYFFREQNGEIGRVIRLFELCGQGETGYSVLARKTGLPYTSVRYILRNPIYTGWRVYDMQRDPSTKRVDADGKYTDAKKIKRAEPIRVRVLEKGIISEELFARVQELLNLKKEMRWRRNNDRPDAFTFRGFLRCAECDSPMLSVRHGNGKSIHDYYICGRAHGSRTRWNARDGRFDWRIKQNSCLSRRIRRERLEPLLNNLIGCRLSDPNFLHQLMKDCARAAGSDDSKSRVARLQKEIEAAQKEQAQLNLLLRKSRMSEAEYDQECANIDSQIAAAQKALAEIKPEFPQVSKETLAELVSPFAEWDILRQPDRRVLLTSVGPVFTVAGYGNGRTGRAARTQIAVKGLYIRLLGDEMPPNVGPERLVVGNRRRRAMEKSCRSTS
jgi:DNA invertase Pin-like site-specific DNA recombinase